MKVTPKGPPKIPTDDDPEQREKLARKLSMHVSKLQRQASKGSGAAASPRRAKLKDFLDDDKNKE
jgi:hypothetical protein